MKSITLVRPIVAAWLRPIAAACLLAALLAAPLAGCKTRPAQKGSPPAAPAPDAAAAAALPVALPPGPYHVLAPLRDTAKYDACAADAECAAAPLHCCDCPQGGLRVAVAAAQRAAWLADSCPPDTQCTGGATQDPTCSAYARCVNGHCRLTIQAQPPPAQAPPATAPSSGTPPHP